MVIYGGRNYRANIYGYVELAGEKHAKVVGVLYSPSGRAPSDHIKSKKRKKETGLVSAFGMRRGDIYRDNKLSSTINEINVSIHEISYYVSTLHGD
jgi:hypothetical protein